MPPKMYDIAMSQRVKKVKDVHNVRLQADSQELPSYRWNERSPAQDMESYDSNGTQPVVVLPEGLTNKKNSQQNHLGDRREAFAVHRRWSQTL